jgi:hypothetical protein
VDGLAIEIDGFSHYYSTVNHELAKSVYKYRMLTNIGLPLLRIKVFDFYEPKEGEMLKNCINFDKILVTVEEALAAHKAVN